MAIYNPYRCLLVENAQLTLFDQNLLRNTKKDLLKEFVDTLKDNYKYEFKFIDRGGEKELVLFFKQQITSSRYIFEFAKARTVPINEKKERGIESKSVNSFPPANIIFDLTGQIFLIEYNQKAFDDTMSTAKYLTKMLDNFMSKHNYHVILEAITEQHSFWDSVEELGYVNSVEFNLVAPNIFGANLSATKLLRAIKQKYNGARLKTIISNDGETLHLDPNDFEINSAAEYAEHGGGKWIIRGKKKGKSKTDKIDSEKLCRKIVIDDLLVLDKAWKEIDEMNKCLESEKDDRNDE